MKVHPTHCQRHSALPPRIPLPSPPQSHLPEAHPSNCKTDCSQEISVLRKSPPADTWAPFCHVSCGSTDMARERSSPQTICQVNHQEGVNQEGVNQDGVNQDGVNQEWPGLQWVAM